jgi:hypothetical protein
MVAQDRRAIGIRLALGAFALGRSSGAVAGRGVALALAGTAAGVALSLALSRLLAASLFGVSPSRPRRVRRAAAL